MWCLLILVNMVLLVIDVLMCECLLLVSVCVVNFVGEVLLVRLVE